MPKPTKSFIAKVEFNQRKLERLKYTRNGWTKNYNRAKGCHSLIHNLVEAYDKYSGTSEGLELIQELKSSIHEHLH